MNTMLIIPGPASKELGNQIAKNLKLRSYPVDYRLFPDGESYIKIYPELKGETAVIVQTTAPDPDRKLMQLFMMTKTAKDFGADRVISLVPYLAYSRQDKRFQKGEALTLDVTLAILEKTGVSDLIVFDIHNEKSLRLIEKDHKVKVHNLSAIPILANYLMNKEYENAFSLSPDKGAIHLAQKADSVLKGGHGFFEKLRDKKTGDIEMVVKDLDVEGKKAIVFDDIISSGGTMAKAVQGLKKQGAVRVAASCSHALFMNGAEDKLIKSGVNLILTTDTVVNPFTQVSISGAVAEYLKSI